MIKNGLFSLLVLVAISCATYKPYLETPSMEVSKQGTLQQSIFLVGGASEDETNSSPTFGLLRSQLQVAGENSHLFLLGNNGATRGLPDSSHTVRRANAESLLKSKLTMLRAFEGDVLITSGVRDWDAGGKEGYKNVLNLEAYVEQVLDNKGNVFLPDNACPGPHEISISEDLVAIVINTQWWLHEWDKPGEGSSCESLSLGDFLVHLKDVFKRNSGKKIVLVGSHPLYSNGPHGGYFRASTHLLPPVAGTIYAGYRKKVGNLQDLSSQRYRQMRAGLEEVLVLHPNVIYVSGHEKSLQYHKVNELHQVISGSAGDVAPVVQGKTASFAHATQGFGKLNFYDNGDVWLEFWTPDGSGGKLAYSKKLFNQQLVEEVEEDYSSISYTGEFGTGTGDASLKRDNKKPGLLGHNYRKEWATQVTAPVFDFNSKQGKLRIIQRGGGMQTRSLRMENPEGKQYVIRSIEKFPEAAVPKILRETFVGSFVKDQLSASHPYGAFVVADMADAVGVYHTNPKLVYVKDDPRLGKYRDDFKNGLYVYEERPAKDRSDVSSFGNSSKIVNTLDVVEKTQKNSDHYVDQTQVLRSRLFDIFLGDWDRHDDQWRWASFKDDDDRTYYQPIPRDRDQAFFFGDGKIMAFASHKWGNAKTQGFHDDIRDVPGLEFNARYFDRSFVNEPTLEDWKKMAGELQGNLTDEVIESSIKQFPKDIYELNGETIIAKLKSRRDKLGVYAQEQYLFLSKGVDVVGTKKRERFEVSRLNEEETLVKVFAVNKNGEVKYKLYERTFKASETKEIRLFGLGGDDTFNIDGQSRKGVKIRIIGGKGDDVMSDAIVSKGPKKIFVYDKKKNTKITGVGIKDKTSDDPDVHLYDRKVFKYNTLFPLVKISANPDDGFIFGGGTVFTKHGFRKTPFAAQHKVSFDYGPKTAAFNIVYAGLHTDVLGKWDYEMELDVHQPAFSDIFYGIGNKSASDEDIRDEDKHHYLTRYSQVTFKHELVAYSSDDKHVFKVGGYYNSLEIEDRDNDEEDDRFILSYPDLVGRGAGDASPLLNVNRHYIGANFDYTLDTRDDKFFPIGGFRFHVDGRVVGQLGDEENSYQQIKSDAAFYLGTGGTFNTTLAVRVGGTATFGDFEFYQGARLGGISNNRGYRKLRFVGDHNFYQNTELRIKLFNFRTSILPGSIGIIAFHDVGRVWSDSPDTILEDGTLEDWHRGYGGGLWISPLGKIVLSTEVAKSNDEDNTLFFIRFGFMF